MLFQEFKLGNVKLRNHIAMTAMATNMADISGGVTQTMIDYYARRAKGGAGLIIIENAGVAPNGRNGAVQLRCDVLSNVPGLGRIADAVHYYGAKAIIQLQHAGQSTKREYIGELPVGPSSVCDAGGELISRALRVEEIKKLVEQFVQAALYAQMAGLDGVEVHAAHAYLLAEFISPLANHRTDEYGGSLENRVRFTEEIVRAIRAKVRPGFLISVRMNGMETDPGGLTVEEAEQAAVILERAGVDLLNVSTGFRQHGDNLSSFTPEGWRIPVAARIRKMVAVPVLCSGGLRRREMMEEALQSGSADLIGVGRQFIADPDWPNKMLRGQDASIRYCLMCNAGCAENRIFGKKTIQCAINPDVGREGAAMYASYPAKAPKSIVVVGAGPAGITFAQEASRRGHKVCVLEKRSRPNGAMYLAASVPGKDGMMQFCRYMERLTQTGAFEVLYQTDAAYDSVMAHRPDAVVFSGGAVPHKLDKVMDYSTGKVVTAHEFLETDQHRRRGQKIAVIGGGSVGCEVADRLADEGNRVIVIEMTSSICGGTQELNRRELMARLKQNRVELMIDTRLEKMEGDRIFVRRGDEVSELTADLFIVAAGGRGVIPEWFSRLREQGIECYAIGEGASERPSNIMAVIHEATALGRMI